jgi:molybdopterin-synthase adenylyltransferase
MTHVLLPGAIATGISGSASSWGWIDTRIDHAEDLAVICGFSHGERVKRQVRSAWLDNHYTAQAPVTHYAGVWYRVDAQAHEFGRDARRRSASLPTHVLREHVQGAWAMPPADRPFYAVTIHTDDDGYSSFGSWIIDRTIATFEEVEMIDDGADLFAPLGTGWPREALAQSLVTVIGAGSIGSSAAESLSSYAIRNLALVDPDRLSQHNFARHRAHSNQVGRMKVNAVADMLIARDPELRVERFPHDVIEDADLMRPLFSRSDCILVASDGVASRRVANHLACRAQIPVVFACVLEDGRIGEIIRARPGITACLLCSREHLALDGAIDPEPSIDRGYGVGHRHRPMTAVGGDLDLVGRIAARAVVSTLLEAAGYLAERLPNDHAVLGLRPALDHPAAPPFDPDRTLQISWSGLGDALRSCPACGGET